MQPSELTVTKSMTIEKMKTWQKVEYTLKVNLNPNDDVEQAKTFAEILIDSWIRQVK